jgi:hypothetical protein
METFLINWNWLGDLTFFTCLLVAYLVASYYGKTHTIVTNGLIERVGKRKARWYQIAPFLVWFAIVSSMVLVVLAINHFPVFRDS